MEIPREISAAEVDRPKMAPGEAASGETAVAAFGAEMEQTSFYGARQELVLQAAQDRVDASALEAKYRAMYETKAEGLDKIPYRDYQKYAQQSIDEVTKEFQNDPIAKDNPRLQSIFAPHLEDYARTFQHAMHLRYVKELQQDGYAQFDNESSRYEQDAAQLPAGPGRDAIFKEMDAKAQDFVKSNLLNPDIVNRRLQAREKNVQESYITNLTGGNNPVDIQHGIDILNAKDSTDTNKIDPEKKAIMLEKAEDHLERVKNKVDNETAMTTALGLMKNNNGDAGLALKDLDNNPEMQKSMGANTYQKTRQLLRDHIEDTKEQQEHESGNISKDIMDKVKSGKLGEALHALDQNRDKMTKSDYEVMSNAITSEKKYMRSEKREKDRDAREIHRNQGDEIFGRLMTDMLNGKELDDIKDIYSQVPKGLSAGQAKMLQDINDGKKDPSFKQATNVVEDAFKSGMIDANKKGKILLDLNQKRTNENLTGDDLIEAATKMVKPHVEHWYTGLLDHAMDDFKGVNKKTPPAPIKDKFGKDYWKWPDGSYHYSPPPEQK